jgi:hypothetical protein
MNTIGRPLIYLAFVVLEVYGVKTYPNGGKSASFLCADKHNIQFTLAASSYDADGLGKRFYRDAKFYTTTPLVGSLPKNSVFKK